ncbi:predicted protein [Nematostella vectensis]|uniref:Uncharacterized protein n=1 Tax=Nematostella vectensis TaxID=45351 RepID=A7SVI2_NEMVE|nr:predicted protein [Nematostella vectensis]|eukprot:XP_001624384.1 predicted protein [Nematostella vectensis]
MAATRVCVGLSACARLSLRSSGGRATRLALDSIRLARPCTVTGLNHESYYYKPSTLTLPRKAMEEKISKIYKVKERGIEIVSLFRLQKILTAAQQRAIEYLMPTALYAKDARPLLLHPNKLFTKRRGRVSYYNCSTSPSLNLCELRITRSDDVESNPGFPGHSLSVFYQNTRSLKAITWDTEGNEALGCKLNRLQDIVYSADYDLVAISETWLNSSILDTEILPHGYDIFRKDRETCEGGGVLLAARSSIAVNQLSLPA